MLESLVSQRLQSHLYAGTCAQLWIDLIDGSLMMCEDLKSYG